MLGRHKERWGRAISGMATTKERHLRWKGGGFGVCGGESVAWSRQSKEDLNILFVGNYQGVFLARAIQCGEEEVSAISSGSFVGLCISLL